jgi:hypothetical protein
MTEFDLPRLAYANVDWAGGALSRADSMLVGALLANHVDVTDDAVFKPFKRAFLQELIQQAQAELRKI